MMKSNWTITAGLPFLRTYTVFEDKGQKWPLPLEEFKVMLIARDAEGRFAKKTIMQLDSYQHEDQLYYELPNKLQVALLPVTTASIIDNGIYWIVLINEYDPEFMVPVDYGRLVVKRMALVS